VQFCVRLARGRVPQKIQNGRHDKIAAGQGFDVIVAGNDLQPCVRDLGRCRPDRRIDGVRVAAD
jgi:hypothetical protein